MMNAAPVYCVKCRSEKQVVGAKPVVFRNGSMAVKGECGTCGSMAYRIVGRKDLLKRFIPRKTKGNVHWAAKSFLIASIFAFGLAAGGLIVQSL